MSLDGRPLIVGLLSPLQQLFGEVPHRQIRPAYQGVAQSLGAITPIDQVRIYRPGGRIARTRDDIDGARPSALENRLKAGNSQRILHGPRCGKKAVAVRRQTPIVRCHKIGKHDAE